MTLSTANKGVASRSLRAAATPIGTPISKDGSSVAATICRWRNPAARKTSSRFAYSLSSERWSSAPAPSSTNDGSSTAVCATARCASDMPSRCKASAAISQMNSTTVQKPPPSDTRVSNGELPDWRAASAPANHTSPASSSAADTTTAAWIAREGRTKTARTKAANGSPRMACAGPSNSRRARPVPDTSRFGATVRKARPIAAPTPPISSAASTRL